MVSLKIQHRSLEEGQEFALAKVPWEMGIDLPQGDGIWEGGTAAWFPPFQMSMVWRAGPMPCLGLLGDTDLMGCLAGH